MELGTGRFLHYGFIVYQQRLHIFMPTPINTTQQATDARLQGLLEEVIADTSYYIVEVQVRGAKGSQSVNIFIDSDEGIGVDELARVSRELRFLIDTEEVLTGNYQLTVSSPGVDRPLKLPRQFRKNVGRTLQVHYKKAEGGYTETTGELTLVDDEGIEVTPPKKEARRIAYDDIEWAKIRLPW